MGTTLEKFLSASSWTFKRIGLKELHTSKIYRTGSTLPGMTFNVYNDNQGIEKILPLDIVPHYSGQEWDQLDKD